MASHIVPPVLHFPTSSVRRRIFAGIIMLSNPAGILWEQMRTTLWGAQTLQPVLDVGYDGRWRTELYRCDYPSEQAKWRIHRKHRSAACWRREGMPQYKQQGVNFALLKVFLQHVPCMVFFKLLHVWCHWLKEMIIFPMFVWKSCLMCQMNCNF